MKAKILLIVILCAFCLSQKSVIAQDKAKSQLIDSLKNKLIDPEDFDAKGFNIMMLEHLNNFRVIKGVDSLYTHRILQNSADDQAEYMATNEKVDKYRSKKSKKNTGERLKYYGGSSRAEEIVGKISIKSGKTLQTYGKAAEDILFKWVNSKKTADILYSPNYLFVGISSEVDVYGKKVYISLVLGNYKSFNNGAENRDDLDIPFTKKKYGLLPYNKKACRKCEKYKNIEDLQKGLYIQDDKVYLKYDNLKALKKIMRGSKDGLAVDFVQREQYLCEGENIIDNTKVNKGVMTKRIWASKILNKNLIEDRKERKKKIDVSLAKVPKAFLDLDDYEMNLIVIQNKYVCKNISQSYIEDGGVEYTNKIDLLADTVTFGVSSDYIPKATSKNLKFTIPFEKAKFDFKKEDIEPFVNSLKEPDFIINDLTITAYSSIEGSDQTNKSLQNKRAQSIQKVLNSRQTSDIKTNIETKDNWEDFKQDVQGTEFSKLADMSINEAQDYIRKNKLHKKLEKILKNHRYAVIDMDVTFDIKGSKEQAYVVKKFNEAIESNNKADALRIQKYIFKKVVDTDYTKDAAFNQRVPENSEYAGILMNKLWLEKFVNEEDITEEFGQRVRRLKELSPANSYILYNDLYCNVIYSYLGNDNQIQETQKVIDELYETTLSKETVDLLNLEYQFNIISTLDTLEETHPLVIESLERIKTIVDIKESNWKNSLKLSYIFINNKDYDFAAKLLEPFLKKKHIFEELVFTYISLCSFSDARMTSNRFADAMKRAREINPERYCKLFDGTKFSIQVLENTIVKEGYCKHCKGK